MAAQNSSMYSQHHRATERMEEVAQSVSQECVVFGCFWLFWQGGG